jgi:hypothetical protein
MGLSIADLVAINRNAFEYAFLPDAARKTFLDQFPAG